jgi:hypothetical protein
MTNIRFYSFTPPVELKSDDRRREPISPSLGSDLNHALHEQQFEQKPIFFTLPPEISSDAGNVIRAVYNENYPLAYNLLSWMKSAARYSALYAFSHTLEKFSDFHKKTAEFCIYLEQKTPLKNYADHLRILMTGKGETFTTPAETAEQPATLPETLADFAEVPVEAPNEFKSVFE